MSYSPKTVRADLRQFFCDGRRAVLASFRNLRKAKGNVIRLKTRLTIRQLTYVQTILSQALTPVPVPLSLSTDYFKGACPALPPSPKISSGQPAPFSASSQTELPAQTRKFKTRTTIVFYRLCFQVLSIENVFTAIKYTRWFRFLISRIVT